MPRKEDVRFLTGQGRYMDDAPPEGALHAVFLRSPVGARPDRRLDVADGGGRRRACVAVFTAADLDGQARERDGLRDGEEPRRHARRRARAGRCSPTTVSATPARRSRWWSPRPARRRSTRPRLIACRLRRAAGARRDRRGRADDPSRGAGATSPTTGRSATRPRSTATFAAAAHTHPARARRQPGDGDADGGARLLRRMGRRAAPRRLLRPGGLGAEGRARREARACRRRRCG